MLKYMLFPRSKVKFSLLFGLLFVMAGCTPGRDGDVYDYTRTLSVAGQNLQVEIANTNDKRTIGLSNRSSLKENQGMLFEFESKIMPSFWMKGMKFPIDIIWINDGKIAGITKNVPAPKPGTVDANLPTYAPSSPINSVLEVLAGWSDRHNVKIGDEVEIK